MNVQIEIENKKNAVDNALKDCLKSDETSILMNAMRYGVFTGGKRFRPTLLLAACEVAGGQIYDAIDFACAIELIHAYSLIHDDLPSMDNDEYRRGMHTTHIVFGEAIAILAGDALLNKAFEVMSEACIKNFSPRAVRAMNIIAQASGSDGMVGGQAIDLISEHMIIDEQTLLYIHEHKTAALIKASLHAGAILGGATDTSLYEDIGGLLGLAFQIKDDCLDVTSTVQVLGKKPESDSKNGKQTYVSMFGLNKATSDYENMSSKATALIDSVHPQSFLSKFVKYNIERNF